MLMNYELAIGTYAINPPSYAHQWAAKGKRLVYMFKKGFWRALLFTKDGKINKELERCAVRGLREDPQFVRSVGLINTQ